MAGNFVQPGDTITLIAPSAVTSGDGVLVGSIFGVALGSYATGDSAEVKITGVWDLAKTTGEAWTQGAKLYWDNTAKKLTTTATGNTLVATAAQAHAAGATVGRALLGLVA